MNSNHAERSKKWPRWRWERAYGTLLGGATGMMLGINSMQVLSRAAKWLRFIPLAVALLLLAGAVIVYVRMPKEKRSAGRTGDDPEERDSSEDG